MNFSNSPTQKTTNTTTTTIVQTSEPANFGKGLGKLCNILDKYKYNTDILSIDLYRWGVQSAKLSTQHKNADAETKKTIIDKQMTELRNEILVNILDHSPLHVPVLAGSRQWTWESAIYFDCRVLFGAVSPLDGETMEEAPLVHEFAVEMIEWANGVTYTPATAAGSSSQAVVLKSSTNDRIRKFVYARLAKDAAKIRNDRELQEQMTLALSKMKNGALENELETERAITAAHERTENHETQLAVKVIALEESYESRINGFQQQIVVVKEEFRRDKAALEAQIVAEHNASSAMANQLRTTIEAREKKFQQDIQGLNQQMNNLVVAQKATENRLQAAASAAESQRQQLATHVVSLEGKMEAALGECGKLKNEIRAEKKVTAHQLQEMQRLQREMGNHQRRIRELEDDNDSSCVIL